ncbi:MAG: PepSY-like domain-containing protein [Muribaculaceae bacterium]|nr:PepSY-like domain-containing protein [Muribaculaceae bacterium]
MFRKLIIAAIAVLGISAAASARDGYTRDISILPTAARTVIADNFKAKVSVIKVDKSFGRVSEYEVILTDGTEISFDKAGNWENIEVRADGAVPAKFVPAAITKYIKDNQRGQKIVSIEREKNGYDIELTNGIEMKFSKDGTFLRYDD